MNLRKGKTKTLLQSSIDSALLAVEVYNKPRTSFRSEAFITLMIIAWTRLFHAHFNATIGDKYYYKKKNSNRYIIKDGERRAWELKTCIRKYGKLSEAERKNLEFFITLRNKIEHRHIDKKQVDVLIFGECQSLLFNYESLLIKLFGDAYALNESLVYSLQFSHLRKPEQKFASKVALSKDLQDIVSYVETFRNSLSDEIFNSQEYSVKLIQVPKISNTERSDLAVEFVKWDELSDADKEAYEKIAAIVKDRKVRVEAANVGKLKPSGVVESIIKKLPASNFNMHTHTYLAKLFAIRPYEEDEDPFDTDTRFCHYDEVHRDYVYTEEWVEFIVDLFQSGRISKEDILKAFRDGEQWKVSESIA
ncbi:MAG: DUF3644 domain-containing protein [Candidatus Rifleibacteriota bacterium]